MSVRILFCDNSTGALRAVPSFRLRQEKDSWVGPEIVLEPHGEPALIKEVRVTVKGKPEKVAARLSAAYYSKRFDEPVPLIRPRSWGTAKIITQEPLPSESHCEMEVVVVFYNATSDGKPRGPERMESAVCPVHSGPRPAMQPELEVLNPELFVLVRQSTTQTLVVRNPGSHAPTISLVYPQTLLSPDDPKLPEIQPVLAELKRALETTFNRTPDVDEQDPTRRRYRWTIDLRFSQDANAILSHIEDGLIIPFHAVLPGVSPIRWLMRLQARTVVFPGWVVIDFGTTNSAVALFDTWDYVPFEGLPEEQENHLRTRLSQWLNMRPEEALPHYGRRFEGDWQRWRHAIANRLNIQSPDGLSDWLLQDSSSRLHPLIEAMEVTLPLHPEPFRKAAYAALMKFYHEALRIPPLRRFQLFAITLDPDTQTKTVSSDIEIKAVHLRGLNQNDRWPEIVMGRRAYKARLEAIGKGGDSPLQTILQRFHHSPKRHFGTDHPGFDVPCDNRVEHVTIDQLMRAGWEKLLALTNEARKEDPRFHEGPIRRAIITYPTVAPPSVRQTIQKLLKDLGIADVRTDYDEAIASAIFYIFREYNTYPELGLELFKARSRIRSDSAWIQNVLVFDIGGGTTDIALIQLTLTEEPVFPPGADQGAGGRYYKLSPRLLSSTGHMQLGGELMTLRIFYRLKAMIADKLLTLTQEGKIQSDALQSVLNAGLPENAVSNGKYCPGWLRTVISRENPDSNTPLLRDALNLMERVFPTRWAEGTSQRAAKLQAFYALWDIAEEAKKRLGSKGQAAERESIRDPLVLDAKRMAHLFEQANLRVLVKDSKALEIRLTPEEMEECILKVVQEAVSIAEGALQRLEDVNKEPGRREEQKLDWLILSGQSCNLLLVDQEIRKTFQKSKKFVWNPERVTFLPEYAKLSAALGACYAETQRRTRFAPADSVQELRRGINVLYFDINNLFSYLPCSFHISHSGHTRELFKAGQEFFELYGVDNPDMQRGCIRSDWIGAALNIAIYRQDYTSGVQRSWGTFSAQDIANRLNLSDRQWQEEIRYQFEVDHRLNIDVLLFRRKQGEKGSPTYRIVGNEPRLDLLAFYPKLSATSTSQAADPATNPASTAATTLLTPDGTLNCDIGIGALQGEPRRIFKAGQSLVESFYLAAGNKHTTLRGLLSEGYAEAFMPDDTLAIYLRPKDAPKWSYVGLIERPGEKPVFPRRYRLTLDEQGVLRIHNGEPLYQESRDPQCLQNNPGWVFRASLNPTKRETDEERNPFTGKH